MANRQSELAKARNRRYNLKHPGAKRKHYESKKSYYQQYERNRQYQKLYGFSIQQYEEMILNQNNCCAVCKTDKPGNKRKYFVVDHDHATGEIRGLLCTGCNVGLGFYEKYSKAYKNYLKRGEDE